MEPGAYISEIFVSVQGEGSKVGQRHLFVRFAGCNMRCWYCDTEYSLTRVPGCRVDYPGTRSEILANPVTVASLSAIVETVLELDPLVEMVAITGGEPMVQREFIARWLRKAPPPRACLLETNAVITEGLREVLEGIEVVSADIKLPSNSGEPHQWERHAEFLHTCGQTKGVDVYVKVPVDARTDYSEVRRALSLIRSETPEAAVFLQPIDDRSGYISDGGDTYLRDMLAAMDGEARNLRVGAQVHKILGIR
jgi:organic radical activating enzyme